MFLSNSLRTEGGIQGYLPTTPFHKRRVKKQVAEIQRIQKEAREARMLRHEGKRRLAELELDVWWDELSKDQQEHARTICLTQGYYEAVRFVKSVGMRNHTAGGYYY